ncbi:MAG TPA: MBL fold metallo-hydrolase [Armatimonadota bacterium]|nr:MBL fold metallo-hydrolase [Armatimonadota bacterium]
MRVTFWGVRGSIPVPGRRTVRYGGNTSCVEVRDNGTLIILDAGSGLRPLGDAIIASGERPVVAHLFITHLHWDHIQGFPFFTPAYQPGNQIFVRGSALLQENLKHALAIQMDPVFFPVQLEEMGADIQFLDLEQDSVVNLGGDITVRCAMLTHPGCPFGYRIDSPRGSLAYITDWEPMARHCATEPGGTARSHAIAEREGDRLDEQVARFCKDVDLAIYDSQYDCAEYVSKRGWGHACIDDVVKIGLEAGVKRLAMFHHDPSHEDARINQMVSYCRGKVRAAGRRLRVFAAREGETVLIGE